MTKLRAVIVALCVSVAAWFGIGGATSASAATVWCSDRAYEHFVAHPTPSFPFVCMDQGNNQINIWTQFGGYYGGMTPNPGFRLPAGWGSLGFPHNQWTLLSSTTTRAALSGVPTITTINSGLASGLQTIRVFNVVLHDELEWFAGGNGWFMVGNPQ